MSRPGRDRRAHRHPGRAGRLRDDTGRHVAVVGGGVAGVAAAVALAERGVAVTLLERDQRLGGRASSWSLPGGRSMSRGFHAFFRQYYNLRALLRRTDRDLARLTPAGDYPLQHADGARDSFAGLPLTPPFNMIGFVLRSRSFRLRELAAVDLRAALELINVHYPATFARYDGESAAGYLDRLRFPPAARTLALEVFSRSFFADPADFSAAELIAMFHAYFLGSSEGLLFDVPVDDYDTALWRPLMHYLDRLGATVCLGAPVDAIALDGERPLIAVDGAEIVADAVVLATDLRATQRLLGAASGLRVDDAWRARLGGLRTAPPFAVCRWWLDRPAARDRPAFLGTAGFDLVDNLSVLERFEKTAADWSARHGGSVVEAHAYALRDALSPDELRHRMRRVVDELYPELRGATGPHELLVRQDCPLIDTAPWQHRPSVTTADTRLVLAGDGIRCDFPVALMERAATTGFLAANALLGQWELAGHDLWTVPLRSRYLLRSA